MKACTLVLPALAFAVAVTNAYTPEISAPVANGNAYLPKAPEPLPPVLVTPQQPEPPSQPHIVLPEPQPGQPSGIIDIVDQPESMFVVQNGIEGYLVPENMAGYTPENPGKTEAAPSILPVIASVFGLIKLPKFLLALLPIFGNGLFLLGIIGAVGAAVCAFTPFCSLTLALPFLRSEGTGVKSIMENERVKPALGFIVNSIEKYREIMRNIEDGAAQTVARREREKS